MTDAQEKRLQGLIGCYRARYGEQHYDFDKVEEKLYELIGEIETDARKEVTQ